MESGIVVSQAAMQEYQLMRSDFELLKQTLRDAQETVARLTAENVLLKQQIQMWRAEVERKARELDELEDLRRRSSSSGMTDLESIRSQLLQEMQVKDELAAQLAEANRFRDQALAVQRDARALHAEREELIQQHQRTLQDLAWQHDQQVKALEATVEDLQMRLGDQCDANRTKILERENRELTDRVQTLQEELDSLRKGLEQATVGGAEEARRQRSRLAELEILSRTQAAEILRQVNQIKNMEEDARAQSLELDRLHSERIRATQEASELRAQADSAALAVQAERQQLRALQRERELELERQKEQLQERCMDLERRHAHLETTVQRVTADRAELERSCTTRVTQAAHDAAEATRALEQQVRELAMEKDEAAKQHLLTSTTLKEHLDILKRENQMLKTERAEVDIQRQVDSKTLHKLEEKLAWAASEREALAKTRDEIKQRLEEKEGEMQSVMDVTVENDRLRLQLEYVVRDVKQLNLEKRELQAAFEAKMAAMQRTAAEDQSKLRDQIAALQRKYEKYKIALDQYKGKLAATIFKAQKRSGTLVSQIETLAQENQRLNEQIHLFKLQEMHRTDTQLKAKAAAASVSTPGAGAVPAQPQRQGDDATGNRGAFRATSPAREKSMFRQLEAQATAIRQRAEDLNAVPIFGL